MTRSANKCSILEGHVWETSVDSVSSIERLIWKAGGAAILEPRGRPLRLSCGARQIRRPDGKARDGRGTKRAAYPARPPQQALRVARSSAKRRRRRRIVPANLPPRLRDEWLCKFQVGDRLEVPKNARFEDRGRRSKGPHCSACYRANGKEWISAQATSRSGDDQQLYPSVA